MRHVAILWPLPTSYDMDVLDGSSLRLSFAIFGFALEGEAFRSLIFTTPFTTFMTHYEMEELSISLISIFDSLYFLQTFDMSLIITICYDHH